MNQLQRAVWWQVIRPYRWRLTLLTLGTLMSGCLWTYDTWKPHYDERITGFLIHPRGHHLYVIGEQYHYAFPVEIREGQTLLASREIEFEPTFSGFRADGTQVSGTLTLRVPASALDVTERERLDAFQFETDGTKLLLNIALEGDRFQSSEQVNAAIKLERDYRVRVSEARTAVGVAKSIALTPLTVVADGIAVVTAVTVFTLISLTSPHGR